MRSPGTLPPPARFAVIWTAAFTLSAGVWISASRLSGPGLRGVIVALVALMLWYSFCRAAITLTLGSVRMRRGEVATLGASALVTILVLEAVFRAFFPQPIFAVEFAPWGFWHIPDVSFVHGADPVYEGRLLRGTEYVTHVSYNHLGMRDPERTPIKPVDTKRIVLLGDSFAEGMEVDFEQTVGRVLERLLNERAAATAAPPDGPAPRARAVPPAGETPEQRLTDALVREIRDLASADGAAFLLANVHRTGAELALRASFWEQKQVPWVDLSLRDPDAERSRYFYRYDPHWNASGHERAARLILARLRAEPGWDGPHERYEVINAGMSAFSTCKELMVYRAIGRALSPNLVVLLYTATDERNLADQDMCAVDEAGRVTVRPRAYGAVQQLLRRARAEVKLHSTFLAWALDRASALPFVRSINETVGEAPISVPGQQR